MNSKKSTAAIKYLLVIIFILQIVTLAWTSYLQFEVRSNAKIEANSLQENASDIRKLKHCHNYNITPCDDSAIRDWNMANPSTSFGL